MKKIILCILIGLALTGCETTERQKMTDHSEMNERLNQEADQREGLLIYQYKF
jgi:hypothetical protein